MTGYDEPPASDGHGGPHPLAGVPQAALDAATEALLAATTEVRRSPDDDAERVCYAEDVEPIAHAVLLAALEAIKQTPTGTRIADSDRIAREAEHVFDVRGWQPGTTEGEQPADPERPFLLTLSTDEGDLLEAALDAYLDTEPEDEEQASGLADRIGLLGLLGRTEGEQP